LQKDNAKTHVADAAAVEGTLQLLARAVRQFHTYPATSPMCVDAITACHDALRSIQHRDRVVSRVTPSEFIVDDHQIGAGTVVEQELARRLFKLRVAGLELDCGATPRDLTRFCIDLVESDDHQGAEVTFAERLAEHGVESIVPVMAHRPVVMDIGVPPSHTADLLSHERRRREHLAQPDAPVNYLYPPDKGWIRLDPGQQLGDVSLLDLVVLVEDPADIATMLVRLTDDDVSGPDARESALERKYSDVTRLFSAIEPRLAQVMFDKLARAVLKLEPERRNKLLQRTILPGLLDGRPDGQVLHSFPDMDLAEAICLLLDLETAAPEVISAALNRLELTPDRRAALGPLIEDRIRAGVGDGDRARTGTAGIERYARELIRVQTTRETDFSEFATFDLSMDDQARTAVGDVRGGIGATDTLMTQLLCVSQLVRIERNPGLIEAFMGRGLDMLAALERAGRWSDVISTVKGYVRLGKELRTRRPDVADVMTKALGEYCNSTRLLALADLYERDAEGRGTVEDLARALGATLVPGFIALMNHGPHQAKARALTALMCELAPTVSTALVAQLDSCGPAAARLIAKVLGHAGAGVEIYLSRLAEHRDQQVAREAIRALARIGTATAAGLIARQIREGATELQAAAEDALWHVPPAQIAAQVRELLRSREFVCAHPQAAARLMDRAAQMKVSGLGEALTNIEKLRFRFWKPSLVQVALKARELRSR
jgi:hypothetical protein